MTTAPLAGGVTKTTSPPPTFPPETEYPLVNGTVDCDLNIAGVDDIELERKNGRQTVGVINNIGSLVGYRHDAKPLAG
jgi:hypothetical protein